MNDQAKFPRHDTGALRKRKARENETPEQQKVLFFHFFSLIIVNIIFLTSRFGFIFREDSKWNVR